MSFYSNKRIPIFLFILFYCIKIGTAQYLIEGYVYESGNRGYIHKADITLFSEGKSLVIANTNTDQSGKYSLNVPEAGDYTLSIVKNPYFASKESLTIELGSPNKLFLKHELTRNPGYIFEITLSEKDLAPDAPKDGLKGALIEVYNNTKKQEERVIESLQTPDFVIDLIKGNHYTILIRKAGFLSKRMEAFVDVKGCILCFEGIGDVRPGVSENLTSENETGTLLANVEMDRYFEGKVIGLNNIYYDFGKSNLTQLAEIELDKVALFLKDNPNLTIELGSHTDSRGGAQGNLNLSNARAKSAVNYLVHKKGIHISKITAKGYGETRLVNQCRDGVTCPEEDHAKNRRTELTITDIEDNSLVKSLRQMKADELLDEILAEISTTQIKITEGDNVQEMMDRVDSDEKIIYKSLDDIDAKGPQPSNEININIPINEENKENPATISVIRPEIIDSDSTTPEVAIPQENLNNKVTDKYVPISIENKSAVSDIVISEELDTPIEHKDYPDEIVNEQIKIDHWVANKTIEEKAQLSDSGMDLNQSIPFDYKYTGFKIVIHFSRFPLKESHKIFNRKEKVIDYITADSNHLYMIGHFTSLKQAESYRDLNILDDYPHAYIVGFEKGIRVY